MQLKRPKPNTVINVFIVAALAVTVYNVVFQSVVSSRDLLNVAVNPEPGIFAIVYIVVNVITFALLLRLVYLSHKGRIASARKIIHFILIALLIGFLLGMSVNGITANLLFYIYQFVCVIAFQLYNDPNLDRTRRFEKVRLLRVGRGNEEEPNAAGELVPFKGYIPLNFFNLFWIFLIGCVLGWAIETVYWPITFGFWQNRAGFLWGPFSPVYGLGAMFMTIALNRLWKKNALLIMLIAAVVGSAVEFFVSWYMETTFGVLAWDYSDGFMNIEGRVDLAHALAWGFLGLFWVRIVLPMLTRIVNVIPLRWRAFGTVVVLAFILTDACMTGLALDCWAQRMDGLPVVTDLQKFFATHYDNEYMASRFESMEFGGRAALHARRG